jgi:hypothetical protein
VSIEALHARNVADVNARMATERRCVMHNPDVHEEATHLVELQNGNVLPMSAACVAQWKADRVAWDDPLMEPVSVTELAP